MKYFVELNISLTNILNSVARVTGIWGSKYLASRGDCSVSSKSSIEKCFVRENEKS